LPLLPPTTKKLEELVGEKEEQRDVDLNMYLIINYINNYS